jgi:membrane protein
MKFSLTELPVPVQFCLYVIQQFVVDRCPATAASLAYTTLLSLVPLFAVMFVFFSVFPAFQHMQDLVEDYVFTNFVPALGESIRAHMSQFRLQATGLGAMGMAVLIGTVVALLATIEGAFNAIWRVKLKRRRILQLLTYWAVVSLGPLLIGGGLAATSYLISLPVFSEVDASFGFKVKILIAAPFLLSFMAFMLIYKLIPNRHVPISHALAGSLVASILFEVAKRGFAYYVTNFPTNQAIYGAFATIPVFLVWIYLCWAIVLLGAEITRSLMTFPSDSFRRYGAGFDSIFFDACRVTGRLVEAQRTGTAMTDQHLLELEPSVKHSRMDRILGALTESKWLVRTDEGAWMLARNPENETLAELYRIVPGPLPVDDAPHGNLVSTTEASSKYLKEKLTIPLAELCPSADS